MEKDCAAMSWYTLRSATQNSLLAIDQWISVFLMDDGPKRMLTNRKESRSNWPPVWVDQVRKAFWRATTTGLAWSIFSFCAFGQSQKIEFNVDVSSVVGQI